MSTIPGYVGHFSPLETQRLRASQRVLGASKSLGLRIREFMPESLSRRMVHILAAGLGVI
jgi:hypothetical protein